MFAFYCELVFATKQLLQHFRSFEPECFESLRLVFSSSRIFWFLVASPDWFLVFNTILKILEMPRLPAPDAVWASVLLKKESSGSSRVPLQYKSFWDYCCCKLVLYELNLNYITALLSVMEHRKEVMLNNLSIIWNDSHRLCLTVTVGNQISWCFIFL